MKSPSFTAWDEGRIGFPTQVENASCSKWLLHSTERAMMAVLETDAPVRSGRVTRRDVVHAAVERT
jgi:hypothetical protein